MFLWDIDPIWLILSLAAIVLSLIAAAVVKSTFNKYNKVRTDAGRTAAQVAREMLDDNGLRHVQVVEHPGHLSDHYDPRSQTVALSQAVYNNATVGAIGVAAHEVGHAIQHATGYAPIKIRHAIFPVVSFGTRFWYILLIIGLMLEGAAHNVEGGTDSNFGSTLIMIAILLYAFGFVFQLITLPLEIDASARALKTLGDKRYLAGKELTGARKVLTAAAFTYLAALIASLIQLLRLLAMRNRR
jgi:hypothetical protein